MGNIIDYLKEFSAVDFNSRPFSREDALCLSQLAYLKFDNLLLDKEGIAVSLKEIDACDNRDDLFADYRYEALNRELYEAFLYSKRFENLEIMDYVNRIDHETETQFSAMTFILGEDLVVATFRGTDENMVGWQEDFRLALHKPILGQKLSVKYLNSVYKTHKKSFFVTGHSKGGNLAVFSSTLANKDTKKHIKKVFCFDGPGVRFDFLEENGYDEIKDRVEKLIPASSVVGLFMNHVEDSIVVESNSTGLSQHVPFNWTINDGAFVPSAISEQHRLLLEAVTEWLLSFDEENIERFVEIMTEMLESTQANTTIEFSEDVMKHSSALIKAYGEIDDDTKKFLGSVVKAYLSLAKDKVSLEVKEKTEEAIEKLEEKTEEAKEFIGSKVRKKDKAPRKKAKQKDK